MLWTSVIFWDHGLSCVMNEASLLLAKLSGRSLGCLLLNIKSESKIWFPRRNLRKTKNYSSSPPSLSCLHLDLKSISLSLGTRFGLLHRLCRDQQDLRDCSSCETSQWDLWDVALPEGGWNRRVWSKWWMWDDIQEQCLTPVLKPR